MAKSCTVAKRKTRASGSTGSESDICSPEGKKICNNSISGSDSIHTSFDEVVKALTMDEKIAAQLQTILDRLESAETKLGKLEGIFERFAFCPLL